VLTLTLVAVSFGKSVPNTRHKDSKPAVVRQSSASRPHGVRKIEHIVFIIKENRSFDTYFGTFAGADGATRGTTSKGATVILTRTPDQTPYDIGHSWQDALIAIDGGRMSKFDEVENGNENGYL